MAAGRRLGRGRVPGRDGLDDGLVFRQRHVRAPRPQRQLELVPDDLGVEPLEQAGRDRLETVRGAGYRLAAVPAS